MTTLGNLCTGIQILKEFLFCWTFLILAHFSDAFASSKMYWNTIKKTNSNKKCICHSYCACKCERSWKYKFMYLNKSKSLSRIKSSLWDLMLSRTEGNVSFCQTDWFDRFLSWLRRNISSAEAHKRACWSEECQKVIDAFNNNNTKQV